MLLQNTESWVHARLAKWDYPVSREWLVLAETWNLHAKVNSKRSAPTYPTPFPTANKGRVGKTNLPSQVVKQLLNRMNPKED